MVTPERLREILRYEPETGKLFWKRRAAKTRGDNIFNAKYPGKEAFTFVNSDGYLKGSINPYPALAAHRVIWALVYGVWPDNIDHKNGDRTDNRLCNLRNATKGINARNQKRRSTNTSGMMGVTWHKASKKWRVRIAYRGLRKKIGMFNDINDAKAAKKLAEQELGFGPNHNT